MKVPLPQIRNIENEQGGREIQITLSIFRWKCTRVDYKSLERRKGPAGGHVDSPGKFLSLTKD